jgi:hypothetical protein
LINGDTPTPTLTAAVPPTSSVTVMVAVPVLEALGVTVKVTGPGPACVGGKTVAIVMSELEALKMVAPPVSLAVKVCDGAPGPENESDTGVTVRVPAVTETTTEL